MDFPFVVPQGQGYSAPLNAVRTVNLYPVTDPAGKRPVGLYGTPGCQEFADFSIPVVCDWVPIDESGIAFTLETEDATMAGNIISATSAGETPGAIWTLIVGEGVWVRVSVVSYDNSGPLGPSNNPKFEWGSTDPGEDRTGQQTNVAGNTDTDWEPSPFNADLSAAVGSNQIAFIPTFDYVGSSEFSIDVYMCAGEPGVPE